MRCELRVAGEERSRFLDVDDDGVENGLVPHLVARRALPVLRRAVAEAVDDRLDMLPLLARPWIHHGGVVQELHELVTRLGGRLIGQQRRQPVEEELRLPAGTYGVLLAARA